MAKIRNASDEPHTAVLPFDVDRLWLRPVTLWRWMFGLDAALSDNKPRLKVPVRVDPRTLESNERLYLTYLHHLTWVGTVAALLISFIPTSYATLSFALVVGTLGVATALALYAFALKMYRSTYLLRFDNVHYEDPVGAAVLTGFLVAIMIGVFGCVLHETITTAAAAKGDAAVYAIGMSG